MQEEDEQEAAAAAEEEDPLARAAALDRQRKREGEEWRLAQLRTGAADVNPNFAVRWQGVGTGCGGGAAAGG